MPSELPSELNDGAFGVRDGLAAGLSRSRMRASDLARPFRGVRASGDFDGSVLARALAIVPRLPASAVFFGITAARIRGLELPAERADEPLHIGVRPEVRAPRIAGVTAHTIHDRAVTAAIRAGLRVTDAASMFCHLAATLPLDDLVAVGDALVRSPFVLDPADPRPWVPLADLRARAASFRGRGAPLVRVAADLVRAGAESRQESRLRVAMALAGLPEPELQAELRDPDGRFVARVDLYDPERDIAIEYEGDIHRSRAQFARDLERYDDLAAKGTRVVRIGASFTSTPAKSLARIERAYRARGWTPP
jgi:hypothetical protein